MNKLEQRELSKKLYDELSDKGLVKKHGDIGFLIWKIAFGAACEYFLQTKENEPKKQCDINGVVVPKGTLCDETESNRKNSSIATYTKDSKPEDYA